MRDRPRGHEVVARVQRRDHAPVNCGTPLDVGAYPLATTPGRPASARCRGRPSNRHGRHVCGRNSLAISAPSCLRRPSGRRTPVLDSRKQHRNVRWTMSPRLCDQQGCGVVGGDVMRAQPDGESGRRLRVVSPRSHPARAYDELASIVDQVSSRRVDSTRATAAHRLVVAVIDRDGYTGPARSSTSSAVSETDPPYGESPLEVLRPVT